MSEVPQAVLVLWWIALVVTTVVVVPVTLRLLHRTWRAAHTISRYAADTRAAAEALARNTRAVGALDEVVASLERIEKRMP